MTERTAYRWDDWVKTYGEPTVWCGFDWPEIISHYVVLPQPSESYESAMAREHGPDFNREW